MNTKMDWERALSVDIEGTSRLNQKQVDLFGSGQEEQRLPRFTSGRLNLLGRNVNRIHQAGRASVLGACRSTTSGPMKSVPPRGSGWAPPRLPIVDFRVPISFCT